MKVLNKFIEYEMLKDFTEGTIIRKRKNVERFLNYIDCNYKTVNEDDIRSYLEYLRDKGLSPERINLAITHLKQFYEYLIDRGEALINPLSSMQRETITNSNSGIFTENDIKTMLKASSTHYKRKSRYIMMRDRSILELLYSTGLRVSELVNLDVDDVDFRNREINVYNSKGEKDRIVPAGDESLNTLREYLKVRYWFIKSGKEFEALFISRQGNRLSGGSFRRMISRRKAEAEVESKGKTHAFRRSFASHMLKRGAPLPAVQRILGHECLDTTEGYAVVTEKDLRELYKAVHPKK